MPVRVLPPVTPALSKRMRRMQFFGNLYIQNQKEISMQVVYQNKERKHDKHKRRFRDMVKLGRVTRFFINGRGSHRPGVGWEVELTRRLGRRCFIDANAWETDNLRQRR